MKYRILVMVPQTFEVEAFNEKEAIEKCKQSFISQKIINQINPIDIKVIREV